MTITIDAIYENGVLKPASPLPLKDHEHVRVTLHTQDSPLIQAYGIMGWKGDAKTLEQIAMDPDLDPLERP